jgi:hypothetical protein
MTSLSTMIRVLGSPLVPYPKSDLSTDLYSNSTSIANMNESDHWISFNLLNKSMISLSTAIGTSDSSLGPHPEKDLDIDLHSYSTPIVIKDESNGRIGFRRLQEIYTTTIRGDQGI